MMILSACFVLLLWGNKNFYQEHLNELWLSKYNQMKREFRYKKAGSYLYRRQFAKPAERLMELLLKIDYEYSVGSKHVIELRKEGLGWSKIARILNAEGHQTKMGTQF